MKNVGWEWDGRMDGMRRDEKRVMEKNGASWPAKGAAPFTHSVAPYQALQTVLTFIETA